MEKRYLDQTVDFLGFLGAKLRDLKGYSTLANEILQNADDAPDVTTVTFDINEMALFVENNGSFREKDFERLRNIAAGAKSVELNTIGIFGIGFLSVYQITDNPIIVSAGKKWTFYPEAEENQRIIEIDCKDYGKTYFGFPWARDPNGAVRTALKLEHITEKSIENLSHDLQTTLPGSILFLRKIENILVKDSGKIIQTIIKNPVEDQKQKFLINDKPITWFRIKTDFNKMAVDLRRKFSFHIEEKKESIVEIAFPEHIFGFQGKFYAFLPTSHITSLPFHINADFFTSSDRKRVLFENDYQALWNEAAIIAASYMLVDNLENIAKFLGAKGFWEFLDRIYGAYIESMEGHNTPIIRKIWEILQTKLTQAEIVYTNSNNWALAKDVYLLQDQQEYELSYIFEQLGIKLVHEDIHDKFKIMRHDSINIALLGPLELAKALKAEHFDQPRNIEEAPEWFQREEGREKLSKEIEWLLHRQKPEELDSVREELQTCCIAISHVNKLNAPKSLWRASKQEIEIFEALNLAFVFTSDKNPPGIANLIHDFDVYAAIDVINLGIRDLFDTSNKNKLEEFWNENPSTIINLIDWFDQKKNIIKNNYELVKSLRALPIWPSGNKLFALEQLYSPGNFEEPLNITSIIDSSILNNYRDLLTILNIEKLNVVNYVKNFVPEYFKRYKKLSLARTHELVAFLSRNLGEYYGEDEIKQIYQNLPIVECEDGVCRKATEVYFYNPDVYTIFGNSIHQVKQSIEKRKALYEFYKWLNISSTPRPGDIINRALGILGQEPDIENREVIQKVFAFLGMNWKEMDQADKEEYKFLQTESWLPAKNDFENWYSPSQLFTAFNAYLFKSQAKFLDMEKQKSYGAFIRFLGIPSKPECEKVVLHLLNCIKNNDKVNILIYRYLNKFADDPAIDMLKDESFIYVPQKGYLKTNQVFLGRHGFGKYRIQLDSKWYNYVDFLKKMGVREDPEKTDAIDVIAEISDQNHDQSKPLSNETLKILVHCFQFLNNGPYDALEKIKEKKIIPDKRNILTSPEHVFFDDRPGLSKTFDLSVQKNFIPLNHSTYKAMNATGVRLLSEAVVFNLVDYDNKTSDKDLQEKIKQRMSLILRVFNSIQYTVGSGNGLKLLDNLQVFKTSSLKIEFNLKLGNKLVKSQPSKVYAYLDKKNNILYYLESNKQVPWHAISREIAYTLNPYINAGQLSPGIKEVLSSPSVREASFILDELGFIPMKESKPGDKNLQDDSMIESGVISK